jgi:hypothetical protein
MLTDNDIKEELSYAYIHAIAARAGMALDYRRKDRDSVDVIISSRRKTVSDYELCSISLELQVKATVASNFNGGEFSFELPIKNYNDLRVKTLCPRLLVVFVMPLINTLWLTTSENDLTLRRGAYWHNLKGEPSVGNTTSKTIWISRKNLFTPEALTAIMNKIARQEEIGHEL